jgi:EmrB/QacA subfamily drug resistance transporter
MHEQQGSDAESHARSGVGLVTYRRRWQVLAVLSLVQFMLLLDDTIVNIALPSMRTDLGFSQTGLAWVVNAYVLMFGGLLLLGGRAADLLGRRLVFFAGLAVFAGASLANALAVSSTMLVVSRGVQGVGAAMIAPAAFSIISVIFTDDTERTKAFAIWQSLGAAGAAAGVVLGGLLTDLLNWRWIFYVNLPVAAFAVIYLGRNLRLQSRVIRRSVDVTGGVVVTGGLLALVYTLLETERRGWASGETLAGLALAVALLGTFVWIEARSANPLVRLSYFVHRQRNTAIAIQHLVAAVLFGVFFLTTLYMQQLLGYSPLEGGLAWFGLLVVSFISFGASPRLLVQFGVRPVLTAGLLFLAAGLMLFARIPVDGSYTADLLPPMAVFGFGLGLAYPALLIAGVKDADTSEAGLAAGVLTSGQQIGGALGLAVLVALAADHTAGLVESGTAPAAAQVDGAQLAFYVAAGLCFAGAVLVARLIGVIKPDRVEPLPPGVATSD